MSQRENLPHSDQHLGAGDPETKQTSLKKGTLGLWGIVFFVVAAAAPLAGMTGAFPVAVGLGDGAGAAGMFVFVGFILLIFSVGYATMSHYVTNTGAFFAYVGRGLGISWGVGSSFASVLAYLTVQWGVIGFISFQIKLKMDEYGFVLAWWVWALIIIAIVFVLSAMSVDIGAKVLGVLLTIEVIALFLVGIIVLIKGGPEGADLGASFAPSSIFSGGLTGGAGIAFAFAFASFIGFEATAIYGEESKDPKRTVPKATYISVILITVLFAVVGFGLVTGLGASDIQNKVFEITAVDGVPLANPGAMLFGVTETFVGHWLAEVFTWIVLTSLFAATLAFQNSASRYLFSMGRSGVLPKVFDRTNKYQAPWVGTVAVTVLATAVTVLFAILNLDPILNMFYWFGNVAVIAIVLTEILVSLSVIVYFRRTKEDTRIWHTVIAPLLAIVGLAVGEYLLVSRFYLLAGVATDPAACPGDAGSGCGPWEMDTTGWILVLLTPALFIVGVIIGKIRSKSENYDAVHNFVS